MWLKLTHVNDDLSGQYVVNMDTVKCFHPSDKGGTTLVFEFFDFSDTGMDYVKESVDEIYDMLRGDNRD